MGTFLDTAVEIESFSTITTERWKKGRRRWRRRRWWTAVKLLCVMGSHKRLTAGAGTDSPRHAALPPRHRKDHSWLFEWP